MATPTCWTCGKRNISGQYRCDRCLQWVCKECLTPGSRVCVPCVERKAGR